MPAAGKLDPWARYWTDSLSSATGGIHIKYVFTFPTNGSPSCSAREGKNDDAIGAVFVCVGAVFQEQGT